MAKVNNADRITREKQLFFINGTQIPGIQSIQINPNYGKMPVRYLGIDTVQYAPSGPQTSDINISSLLISNDQFIQYTGNLGFNGHILKTLDNAGDNYSFISGYCTNYNSRCSIGEIPQINVSVTAFGKAGRISALTEIPDLNAIQNNPSNIQLKVPGPGSIDINIDDFETNRVLSYDLNIKTSRNPIYILGDRNPNAIELNFPIEMSCVFEMDLDEYAPINSFTYPGTNTTKTFTIRVKDYTTDANIVSYSLPNMTLINESYSTNVDNNTSMTIEYQGFMARMI